MALADPTLCTSIFAAGGGLVSVGGGGLAYTFVANLTRPFVTHHARYGN